ncbi:SGNH/GDSL hydrolase family protein [Costertonia aggregata]|uniref:G-D-S-L family lipolytic protein n=1 Tax=Costertonia aggregata TaxID=343403 RepID=A0A7H9ASF3_9FLAO|nr:SGNH/GDSL hydrolase family protein [Costertonia aggregata]QLG46337.1 G-D-S-L family lipolytic protein [Costertonia aggregata]
MRFFIIMFLFCFANTKAQETLAFAQEVEAISKKYDTVWDSSKETIVFTGSSSIRVWKNLETVFPGHQIVNSGFGGSQTSDLLSHTNELILKYNPKKVFIYEGDNDISSKKRPGRIIDDAQQIITRISKFNPDTKIILISAKPSMARWHLKRKYKRLNRKLKRLSQKNPKVDFADVWSPMLAKRKVRQDIFVDDGLHMNNKGYDIWYSVIKEYIE